MQCIVMPNVLSNFTEFKGQSVMQTKMLDPDLYDEHKRTPNSHLGDRSLPNVAQNARGSNLVHVEQSLPDTQLQILEEHAFLIKVLAILAS